jgi:hypothetical protein
MAGSVMEISVGLFNPKGNIGVTEFLIELRRSYLLPSYVHMILLIIFFLFFQLDDWVLKTHYDVKKFQNWTFNLLLGLPAPFYTVGLYKHAAYINRMMCVCVYNQLSYYLNFSKVWGAFNFKSSICLSRDRSIASSQDIIWT